MITKRRQVALIIDAESVVIQADERATADAIIKVMDQSREAGVFAISLASEPKF